MAICKGTFDWFVKQIKKTGGSCGRKVGVVAIEKAHKGADLIGVLEFGDEIQSERIGDFLFLETHAFNSVENFLRTGSDIACPAYQVAGLRKIP